MSELKEIELGEAYKVFDDDKEFYLKSETDKVIAELKQKINEAQTELELWRDGSIISEAHQKELDGKCHSDFKRCMAMAKWCDDIYENSFERILSVRNMGLEPSDELTFHLSFFKRWQKRWLKLAEKFKEAK